jgi:hypothetical protein
MRSKWGTRYRTVVEEKAADSLTTIKRMDTINTTTTASLGTLLILIHTGILLITHDSNCFLNFFPSLRDIARFKSDSESGRICQTLFKEKIKQLPVLYLRGRVRILLKICHFAMSIPFLSLLFNLYLFLNLKFMTYNNPIKARIRVFTRTASRGYNANIF